MKLVKWAEQVQDRLKWKDIVERPRLSQSCSAIEEEELLKQRTVTTHPNVCPIHRSISTRLHAVTYQITVFFISHHHENLESVV